MEKNKVVNYMYALMEIPRDESAESLKNVLVARLEKDGIIDEVKKRMVGFISDSAPVMVISIAYLKLHR